MDSRSRRRQGSRLARHNRCRSRPSIDRFRWWVAFRSRRRSRIGLRLRHNSRHHTSARKMIRCSRPPPMCSGCRHNRPGSLLPLYRRLHSSIYCPACRFGGPGSRYSRCSLPRVRRFHCRKTPSGSPGHTFGRTHPLHKARCCSRQHRRDRLHNPCPRSRCPHRNRRPGYWNSPPDLRRGSHRKPDPNHSPSRHSSPGSAGTGE